MTILAESLDNFKVQNMEIGQHYFLPVSLFGIVSHIHAQVLLSCGIILIFLFSFIVFFKQNEELSATFEIFFQFIRGIAEKQHAGSAQSA